MPALWFFVIVATSSGAEASPAALTDPEGARQWAEAHLTQAPLRAAETAWLAGEYSLAERALKAAPDSARKKRLAVDLALVTQMPGPTDALKAAPGWSEHAKAAESQVMSRQWRRYGVRVGIGLYALALAGLGLIGSRELLRLTWETGVLVAAWVGAVILAQSEGPAAATFAMLVGAAGLTLGHAAAACIRRLRPGVRWRLMALVLVTLGVLGVAVSVTIRVGPVRLFS